LVKIEHGVGIEKDALDNLAKKIAKDISDRFGVPSEIEFVSAGALGRVTKKTPLFEEQY
jgi:phenylacetate-coenzyme A ligase PaaK-like adenylate-forming protein